MIGGNPKQKRIRDLLSQASATGAKGEDESIPRLVRREPREHSLPSRLDALDSLTRLRNGVGRPTRRAAKLLLSTIRATAAAENASGQLASDLYQELRNRADEIESRLKSVKVRRETKIGKQQLTKAEQEKLLVEATEPFDVAPGSVWKAEGFDWYKRIVDGRVAWLLVVPATTFEVMTRREFNEQSVAKADEGNEPIVNAGPDPSAAA